ncbi:zinc-dependent alcohol dehydrogenase family protein [Caballeronia sp. M1242]|uniref:zinc-dependent alcohol dehydrogenase family protein n=1 Tax=Caballeronia sp. M1242 TaxID=2814653 RepID=UPI0019CF9F7F|nr:zinc-dependent alcohol dehydrogenase family protein [Caballeronia sp. M1242]QSN64191.1 zinc-dependent alcohol dehydrogenase family protein [Caballeronia sp. M1242]
MKAFVLNEFGVEGHVLDTFPIPEPQAGELLVAVHASGVNPADLKIKAGELGPAAPALPAILGMDFAGMVAKVGAGVEGFDVGDAVYGCAGGVKGRAGSLAEYMVVDARLVAPKPARLSMREAAALPLVAITAWEGLVDRAKVSLDEKVLVHAAAGGVGHIAIQLAKIFGAQVFATASTPEKLALAERLGAVAIPYRDMPTEDYVARYTDGRGFDIVYDTVGGPTLEQSAVATRLYGRLVTCAAWGQHNLAPVLGRSLDLIGIFMLLPMLTSQRLEDHGVILRKIAALVDEGKLSPVVDPIRFQLADTAAAHARLDKGEAVGKVVIDIVN